MKKFSLALLALSICSALFADPPGGYKIGDRTPDGHLVVGVQGQVRSAATVCVNGSCSVPQAQQERQPLIRFGEYVQIRGNTYGYSIQSRPPFINIQRNCQGCPR